MAWTDDKKQEAVELYLAEAPTAATSAEIVKSIAEKLEESPNGVRMILNAAGVYVKVEPSSIPAKKGSVAAGGEEKAPRVSKESQQKALVDELKRVNAEVDEAIIEKLTGKAAAYFAEVIKKLN